MASYSRGFKRPTISPTMTGQPTMIGSRWKRTNDSRLPHRTEARFPARRAFTRLQNKGSSSDTTKKPKITIKETKMSESTTGDHNPMVKLTWRKVREIRAKYVPHEYSLLRLAKEYCVSKSTINDITLNKAWIE